MLSAKSNLVYQLCELTAPGCYMVYTHLRRRSNFKTRLSQHILNRWPTNVFKLFSWVSEEILLKIHCSKDMKLTVGSRTSLEKCRYMLQGRAVKNVASGSDLGITTDKSLNSTSTSPEQSKNKLQCSFVWDEFPLTWRGNIKNTERSYESTSSGICWSSLLPIPKEHRITFSNVQRRRTSYLENRKWLRMLQD